ncbi:MAG TPA: hypothetical protein VMU54_18070 [Planctomycetota bacterium]|nr:hypothetical protein [Planctomycetota bacterium]
MSAWMLLLALQQAGIASEYPGDDGISRDPRVLLSENFETGDLRSIGARRGDVAEPQNLELSDDVPAGSAGRRSLKVGPLFVLARDKAGREGKLLGQ